MLKLPPFTTIFIGALAGGGLERRINPIIDAANSTGALVTALVAAVIATNAATADRYIAIVLPALMFKNGVRDRGLVPVAAAREVGRQFQGRSVS